MPPADHLGLEAGAGKKPERKNGLVSQGNKAGRKHRTALFAGRAHIRRCYVCVQKSGRNIGFQPIHPFFSGTGTWFAPVFSCRPPETDGPARQRRKTVTIKPRSVMDTRSLPVCGAKSNPFLGKNRGGRNTMRLPRQAGF
jgi:hypothetical protein